MFSIIIVAEFLVDFLVDLTCTLSAETCILNSGCKIFQVKDDLNVDTEISISMIFFFNSSEGKLTVFLRRNITEYPLRTGECLKVCRFEYTSTRIHVLAALRKLQSSSLRKKEEKSSSKQLLSRVRKKKKRESKKKMKGNKKGSSVYLTDRPLSRYCPSTVKSKNPKGNV